MQKYLQDCWFKVSTIYVHESKYYWNTTNSIHLYLDMSACKTCWWVLALKATLSTLLYTRVPQLLDILALSKSQVQSLCSGVMMSGWLEISTTQMYPQSATHELCKYVLNANGRCPYDCLTLGSLWLCWLLSWRRFLDYFMDRNIFGEIFWYGWK